MTNRTKRLLATAVAMSLSFAGLVQAAPLGAPVLISTEQAAAATAGRARVEQTLARADVEAALQARGVRVDAVRDRVAALTDAEAAQLAAQIDQAPAGADGVLGTLVFLFVLLLVTDILGLTKVFPFTRAVR
jgi:hypothetical protein